MAKIWANRLVGGTKTWGEVPESRKDAVRKELELRVEQGILSQEKFNQILGIENTEASDGEI